MSKFAGLGGRLYRGETSVDFIGKRRRWYAFSGILIVASGIALSFQGLHLGIEFKGGSAFTVTKTGISIVDARSALDSIKIPGEPIIQKLGSNKVRIQTDALSNEISNQVQDALASKFGISVDSIDTQTVGPSWGKEITRKALYGLFGFLIVVLLYLAMAFEPKMAIAAIISVIHDLFITVGIYAIVGFDVTPATVIGFLTILGYSLYDTVVVFDKIRENTRTITSTSRMTYSQAANLAVNQTLVRSINTSIIALLPVGSILFVGAGLLGAGTLKDLSLALFIGLAAGTYSSIFIATPILATLREQEPAMQALAKRVAARNAAPVAAAVRSTESPSAKTEGGKNQKRGPRNQPKKKGRR
ncbi:MAG: protein translocase subunit SecF [Actinobacteria bacterium]|nr:protein translocase subunit SecF [Actinomycetota bacterium]